MLSKNDIRDFIEINRGLYGEQAMSNHMEFLVSVLRDADVRHVDGLEARKDIVKGK